MPVQGSQNFALAGARLFFRETSSDPAIVNPLVDLGVVQMEPAIEQTKVTLQDSASGVNQTVAEAVSSVNESYNLTCFNISPYNMGILYGASLESFTQAATPIADAKHYAWPDQPLGLLDDDYDDGGERVYQIDPGETFTVNEDDGGSPGTAISAANYTVDYDKGILIIATAGLASAAVVWVSFTPTAITGQRRLRAQSRDLSRQGTFELWIGQENNSLMTVRTFEGTISGEGLDLSADEFSNIQFAVTVTSDLTNTTIPAGDIKFVKGTLPTVSGPTS